MEQVRNATRSDFGTQRTVVVEERRGPVLLLTLNRPAKLNAMNNEMVAAISAALARVEFDDEVRAVVVTGVGRAFCAGADIAELQQHVEAGSAHAVTNFMKPGHKMTRQVENFPKPVIAAVNGMAFGAGCELVESVHMALVARSAEFSKAEIGIAIIPTFGGTQRLSRHVGRKAALELILTGRRFGADEALRLGLVNAVTADDELLDRAMALATQLSTQPRQAVAAALFAVQRGMEAAIDDGLAVEEAAFARIVPLRDTKEGISAFLEKRKPVFTGR